MLRFLIGIAGIVLIACLSWSVSQSNKLMAESIKRDLRIEELRGEIVYLDEVLTMSARMAAATGDLRWEKRYRSFVEQLNNAILTVQQLAPGVLSTSAAHQTDTANLKLIEMENCAFDLVRAANSDSAKGVLFSEEYDTQKRIYAKGMELVYAQLREDINRTSAAHGKERTLNLVLSIAIFVILLFLWLKPQTTANPDLANQEIPQRRSLQSIGS